MVTLMRKSTWSAVAVSVALGLGTNRAEAGPFLDWLLGRPVYTYPGPVATEGGSAAVTTPQLPAVTPPQVTYYPPASAAAGYPGVAPLGAAQPVPPTGTVVATYAWPAGTAAPAQPIIAGYAPYTANYRTVWNRVPVTAYKAVTTYNVSGYPVVVGQPCNTYTWQAQRVPTLFGRPLWPFRSPGLFGTYPAPNTTMYTPYYPTVPAAGMMASPNPTCPNCFPTTVAPPTVAPPAAAYPAPVPSVPTPAYGTPPSYPGTVPGAAPQLPSSPSPEAADQAPTLVPSPSANSAWAPDLQPTPPPNSSASRGVEPEPARSADSASSRLDSTSPYRVTPIPAPDIRAYAPERSAPQAPPLLNGRDRTAFDTSRDASRIEQTSWKEVRPASLPNTERAPAAPQPARTAPLWNDDGWRN